jgi:hypothetical protein
MYSLWQRWARTAGLFLEYLNAHSAEIQYSLRKIGYKIVKRS